MNIVFIHGMNQQQFNALSLRKHWLNIFRQGLKKYHLPFNFDIHQLHFPFYGDLLTQSHLTNTFDLETFLPKSLINFHLPVHLNIHHTTIEHQASLSTLHPDHINTKSIKKQLHEETMLIKDRSLKELMILLNHFPKLHESLIHQFLVETYCYLANPQFIHNVHQRILLGIPSQQPCIVVAHSLGSVIAYNLLCNMNADSNIQCFITLGSPLAFRVIQQRLSMPIHYPESLHGRWYNFYSHDDFLTAFPLQKPPFDFNPPIFNQEISTSALHPHQIMSYLQHPDVLKTILKVCCPFENTG